MLRIVPVKERRNITVTVCRTPEEVEKAAIPPKAYARRAYLVDLAIKSGTMGT